MPETVHLYSDEGSLQDVAEKINAAGKEELKKWKIGSK